MVELNPAVALAMARGPEAGLVWIERVEQGGELGDYHLLAAARADLLRRLGRRPEGAAPIGPRSPWSVARPSAAISNAGSRPARLARPV